MSRNISEYNLASWRKERIQKVYYSLSVRIPYAGLTWLPKVHVTGWLTLLNDWEEGGRVQKTKGQGPLSLAQQMPAEGFFLKSCRPPKAVSQRHWLSSNLSKHRKSTIWESSRWWKIAATHVNADNICAQSCVGHISSKEKAYRSWREVNLLGNSLPRRWGLTLCPPKRVTTAD